MKSKRTKLIVNPHFQWKVLVYVNLMLGVLLTPYYYFWDTFLAQLSRYAFLAPSQINILRNQTLFYMIVIQAVIHLCLCIFLLIMTHRIAGPMVRFRKILESFTQNNFPKIIRMRKNDHFTELEPLLNEVNQKMRQNYLEKESAIQYLEEISLENEGNYESIVAKFRAPSANTNPE